MAFAIPDGRPDARCAGSFGIKLGGALAGGAEGAAAGVTFAGTCPEVGPDGRLSVPPPVDAIFREGIFGLFGVVERGLLREGMFPLFRGLVPGVFR